MLLPILLVRAGHRRCALRIGDVIETMRALPLNAVSGAPPFVRGMSVVRGAPMLVVALADLVGGGVTDLERLVTLRCGDRAVAVAVDEVLGVVEVPSDDFEKMPPLLTSVAPGIAAIVATADRQLLMLLDVSKLVPA